MAEVSALILPSVTSTPGTTIATSENAIPIVSALDAANRYDYALSLHSIPLLAPGARTNSAFMSRGAV
jgi:hypothetical protein